MPDTASHPPDGPRPGTPSVPPPEERSRAPASWDERFLGPRRSSGPAAQPGRPHPGRSARLLLAVILVALLALFVWELRPTSPAELPADLLGTWRTTAAPYADRALAFYPHSVVLDQGEVGVVAYGVRHVIWEQVGPVRRYRVVYRAEGGDAELAFEHNPADRTLRILTRPQVLWRRQ